MIWEMFLCILAVQNDIGICNEQTFQKYYTSKFISRFVSLILLPSTFFNCSLRCSQKITKMYILLVQEPYTKSNWKIVILQSLQVFDKFEIELVICNVSFNSMYIGKNKVEQEFTRLPCISNLSTSEVMYLLPGSVSRCVIGISSGTSGRQFHFRPANWPDSISLHLIINLVRYSNETHSITLRQISRYL